MILISVTKNTLQLWKENELWKVEKKWKTMKNNSINFYCINFFIVIKKLQKIGKNFCTDTYMYVYIYIYIYIYIKLYMHIESL